MRTRKSDSLQLSDYLKEQDDTDNYLKECRNLAPVVELLVDTNSQIRHTIAELDHSRQALEAAMQSSAGIVSGISRAIVSAQQRQVKVGIDDQGLRQLDERNDLVLSNITQALEAHERHLQAILRKQEKTLDRIALPPMVCYMVAINLALLLMFFAGLVVLNAYRLHNDLLADYLWVMVGTLVGINGIVIWVMRWMRK